MLKVLGFFSKFFTKCVGHEEAIELVREKNLVIEKLEKNIANKNSKIDNLEASYDEVNLKLGEAETKLIAAIAKNSNLEKELEAFNNVSVEAVSEDISEINKLNDEVKGLLSLLKAKEEENVLLSSKVKELEKKIRESLNSNEESPDLKRSITKTILNY